MVRLFRNNTEGIVPFMPLKTSGWNNRPQNVTAFFCLPGSPSIKVGVEVRIGLKTLTTIPGDPNLFDACDVTIAAARKEYDEGYMSGLVVSIHARRLGRVY